MQGVLDAFPAIGLQRRFRIRRTRWGADPLFRGSYSYCPASAHAAAMDELAAPVVPQPYPDGPNPGESGVQPLPRVLFAGEATHRQFFGTVHGAYFSVRPRQQSASKEYWDVLLAFLGKNLNGRFMPPHCREPSMAQQLLTPWKFGSEALDWKHGMK